MLYPLSYGSGAGAHPTLDVSVALAYFATATTRR